jgi:outer membrane protein insertion porin family
MTIRSLIILIVLATAPADFASGQPEDVWKLVSNYKGWPVSKLSISGVDSGTGKRLVEGLDLAHKDATLYEARLRGDIERIRLYLARRGHPYARVTPGVEPNEEKRRVKLTLEVDRGPPVSIRRYDLVGVPEHLHEEIKTKLLLRPEGVFVDDHLATDIESVIEELKKDGYARATAASALEWADSTTVGLAILAAPGTVRYFREVTVQGVAPDLEGLAYTLVDIKRGDRYEPRTMTDARDFLSRAGLFRQIRLTLEDAGTDSLDVIVDLQERKPRSIETAFGYWTDDLFSVRMRWGHRNVFKRGRGMSFEVVYTQFRQYGEWATWWPALFGLKKSLGTFRGGLMNESEDSYEMTAPTAGTYFGYTFTRRFSSSLGFIIQRASYEIKTSEREMFQDPEGTVGWIEARLNRDATDDRINPTKGLYSWLLFQWGPKGGVSQANWILTELNASYLIRLKSTVLATNLHAGWAKPIEPATVLLPDHRFYSGGAVSHRGFYRRRLGPKDENDLPLGGEVMVTGFVEYRFPVVWKFNGAVFVDWGQVWRTREDVGMGNIEVAVGPALRIMTPVGPLRFDWGIRVTDYDTSQPSSAFHFAIGYPM